MNLETYTYPKTPIDAREEVQAPLLGEARAVLGQANAISSRIMELADRLCGGRDTGGSDERHAENSGAFERFRAEMRDTRQAMVYADDALTRIEQELIG